MAPSVATTSLTVTPVTGAIGAVVDGLDLHHEFDDATAQMLRECAGTILDETTSVKRLVDEFSQFSRLPAAKPVRWQARHQRRGRSLFEAFKGVEPWGAAVPRPSSKKWPGI